MGGYEVDALSYLLKPVAYASFEQEMSRILTRLQRSRRSCSSATDGVHHRVAVDDIRYIRSIRHRVRLYTLGGVQHRDDVEGDERLADKGFLRAGGCS
ncbi:hypothetical protein [Microbacterium sp.]|uniref:hypothetical protein n=1 Tax=Microbacterium sp. TaxID=51671 RepID=UPI003A91AC50